ncbi:uncharacterized protein N7473_009309 [Penicillium subrubescens]|uniref:Phosphoribosylaminoimidazole-succinocarboxamide synthase n=1 Tax=Penicillium subrubescens TaxID=1316194 RepID=A0A1Q5TAS8_9EURO|nr:uncharacterized protein N7473_009309 [Penicillium subrubescens]KAJ5886635.1 hypothetical protein N7473_009309 [Penicillium subrubescens]OKO97303.1 hypothetical protein PENSUB_10097 [Penicillium subrubescens]
MSDSPTPRNFSLRNVSTSKPQVYRTESRQSAAASDDYYSFSDRAASSSPDSRVTAMRFDTPDSHQSFQESSPTVPLTQQPQHPAMSQDYQQQQLPAPEDLGSPRPGTASTIRFGEDRVARISPKSDDTVRRYTRDYAGPAPTPGLDDSPYVRFAIDQLTRDEEVGVPQRHDSISTNQDYPNDRLVWDQGLGYFTRARTPIRHTETPPRPNFTSPSPQALPQRPNSVDPESFVAVDPPEQSLLYPPLDYLPMVLRPWAVLGLIFCCLLMIAGVVFCNIWSHRHEGIWNYNGQGGARYFVMQFLPQILAAPIIIWSFVVQAAVYRISPFAMMAAERKRGSVLQGLPILPRNFVFPDHSHFRYGEPLFGFSLFTIWLSNFFAIPLLSCVFQAKYYVIDGQGLWRWASVQAVVWAVVAMYGLQAIGLLLLVIRFIRGWTGLMWDPICLADLISIIQRSNILHDYEHSETVPSVKQSLDPRVLRLGYWKLSMKPEIFYGIGEVDAPIRTPSLHQTEKSRQNQPHGMTKVRFDLEQNGFANDGYDHHLFSPFTRYRWTPWFLRIPSVIVWTIIVFALFIAFITVSFVNNAIEGGFPPKLPTLPSTSAFSSSNFLYSFIPAVIGNVLFLAWQPIDMYFRALQPFVELSAPNGASADKSLLLAYPTSLPIQVTLQAIINGHFKVAWLSFMSLISLAIPILAGGVFIALWYPDHDDVRISSLMPAFYALIAFCGLYAVSFLAIWPGRRRYLPHDITTLADLMSYLYQSPLLADKLLREPRSKTDLVTRLIVAPPSERMLPMYGFGIYVGRDGKEHLGIDRLHRPGRADMLITTGTMKT